MSVQSREEALEQLRSGMNLMVRRGSQGKKRGSAYQHSAGYISTGRVCFCTDDKHVEDIRREGHISSNIREAIHLGVSAGGLLYGQLPCRALVPASPSGVIPGGPGGAFRPRKSPSRRFTGEGWSADRIKPLARLFLVFAGYGSYPCGLGSS